ncbi:hypothetical protein E2542_SST06868 [Spatholobus suberectus]|nr:hypothetical protein E2542_SST06868 [Spatholobus suberectus]
MLIILDDDPHSESSRGKVSRLESSVEVIINGLNNLTNIVATQTPRLSHMNTQSTLHFTQHQSQTPQHSTLSKRKKEAEILVNLTPTVNVTPTSIKRNTGKNKTKDNVKDKGLKKRLFSQTISSKGCGGMFADMEPLNNAKYDGMKTTVEILKTIGDRATLKNLQPRGFVDQEVLKLLVCMLTIQERSISTYGGFWYLPTTMAVYNETRMKLALDLVLNSYNTNKYEIIKLAAAN